MPMPPQAVHASPSSATSSPSRSVQPEEQSQRVTSSGSNNSTSPSSEHHRLQPGLSSLFSRFTGRSRSTSTADQRSRAVGSPSATSSSGTTSSSASHPEDAKDRLASILASAKHRQSSPLARESSSGGSSSKKGKKQPGPIGTPTAPFLPAEGEQQLQDEGPYAPTSPYVFLEHLARFDKGDDSQERLNLIQSLCDAVILFDEIDSLQVWFAAPACSLLDASAEPLFIRLAGIKLLCTCIAASESSLHVASRKIAFYNSVCRYAVETKDCTDQELDGLTQALSALCKGGRDVSALDGLVERTCDFAGEKFKRRQAERDQIRVAFFDQHPQLSRLQFVSDSDRNDIAPPLLDPAQASVFVSWPYASASGASEPSIKSPAMTLLSNVHKFGWPLLSHDAICFATAYLVAEALATSNDTIVRSIIDHMDVISRFGYVPSSQIQGVVFFLARVVATESAQRVIKFCDEDDNVLAEPELHPLPSTLADEAKRVTNNLLRSTANQALAQLREGTKPPSAQEPQRDLNVVVGCLRCLREAMGRIRASIRQSPDAAAAANSTYLDSWPILLSLGIPLFFNNLWDALEWSSPAVNVEVLRIILDRLIESTSGAPKAASSDVDGSPSSSSTAGEKLTFEEWDMILDLLHEIQRHIQRFEEEDKVLWMLNLSKARPENYDANDLSHDTSGLDTKSAVLTLYRRILHYIVQSYLNNALDASTNRLFYVLYSLGPNLTDESVVLLIDGYIKENICLPSNPEWIEDLNDIVYGFLMTDASDLTASQSLGGEQRDPDDIPDTFSQRPIRPMARFKSLQLVSDVYQSVRDFEEHRVLLVDRIVIPTIDHLLSAGVEPNESQVLNQLISSVAKDAFRNLEEAPEKSKKILVDLTAALVEASTTTAHLPRQGRARSDASPSRKSSDPERRRSGSVAPPDERIRVNQFTPRPAMADFATIKLLDMFTIGLSTSGAHAAREGVTVFRQLLSLLRDQTTPRKTRFFILQYVLRLRATARHRVSLVRDVDIFGLAEIVSRTSTSPSSEAEPSLSKEVSTSEAAETGGDRRRGRKTTTNPSPDRRYSRSKSRIRFKDRSVSTQLRVANDPLWHVPEVLPFSIPAITGEESVGLVSFDHTVEWSESLDVDPSEADFDNYTAALAARPEDAPVLLPVSEYLQTLQSLLRADTDWDLSAYILCHLPVQLSCKHFFAGPRASRQVKAVRDLLAEGLMSNTLGARTLLPEGNKRADLPSLAYHTLATLTAYKSLFSKAELDELVQTFATGLTQREVAKPCIHALAMACHELQPSMTKHLSQILANLLKIMSTARMAVHILELIASIGHLPSLSSSFTSDDYRTVLGIALQYIALHNDRTALVSSTKESTTPSKAEDIEHAFAQYVFHLAYIVIELWYLRMRLPQRRQQAPFIVRKLLQANEGRGSLDEASEVCLDMVARYATGDIDPRPKRSGLKETLWNGSSPGQSLTRTWIQGHAVMSIRCLANTRWAEVVVRRPSGVSHLLLEVANTLEPAIETVSAEMLETVLKHRESLSPATNASLPEELSAMSPDGVVTLQQIRDKIGAQIPTPAPSNGQIEEDPPEASQAPITSSVTPSYFALQLSAFPEFGSSGPPLQIPDEDRFQRSIRNLDAVPVVDFHKIGVIYVGQDDETEKDILSNAHGSKDYVNLLSSLGNIVRLRNNTEVYLGGLDRDNDLDGKWAYVWSSSGVQMVYHVATLMPTRQDTDPQCIGKKRHIGNDFVKIIFNDSGRPFHSDMLPGQFNFVDIVIEPQTPAGKSWTAHGMSSNTAFFKVSMQRRVDMPEIGPLGVFKMVSAKSLSDCVRHLALHANIFAQVFLESVGIEGGRGGTRSKTLYVSNWGRRLQYIKQLRERVGSREELPSQTAQAVQPINLEELAQSLDLSRWAY